MRAAQFAYVKIVHLARADGRLVACEVALLDRYRRALRVPRRLHRRILSGEHDDEPLPAGESSVQRLQVTRMMVRVAVHDGQLHPLEFELLESVADALEVDPLQFADLLIEAEHDLERRAGARRWRRAALIAGGALLALIAGVFVFLTQRGDRRERTAREELTELRAELDEEALARARADERRLRRTIEERELREGDLRARIAELEGLSGGVVHAADTAGGGAGTALTLRSEIEALRAELEGLHDQTAAFQRIERECSASVLLICVRYHLVAGAKRITRWASGTGFLVTPLGHIVTNKHVAEPWKFDVQDAKLRADGYVLDETTVRRAAWPVGARILRGRSPNWSTAYGSPGALRLERVTADQTEVSERPDPAGGTFRAEFHVLGVDDLAILKAEAQEPLRCIPLESDTSTVEKLDPILVLGFPRTIDLLETEWVETAPAVGEVRKVEDHIFTTAPIVGGNSGGPVIDRDGNAIGVVSWGYDEPTLNANIPVRHVLELLPEARTLVEEARGLAKRGECGAVLDLLVLAEQRGGGGELLDRLREEALRERRDGLERARALQTHGDLDGARGELEALESAFGPRWGAEVRARLEGLDE